MNKQTTSSPLAALAGTLLITGLLSLAIPETQSLTRQSSTAYEALLERADLPSRMSTHGVPGVSFAVIKKGELRDRYGRADDPYEIALRFCLERTFRFMADANQPSL